MQMPERAVLRGRVRRVADAALLGPHIDPRDNIDAAVSPFAAEAVLTSRMPTTTGQDEKSR